MEHVIKSVNLVEEKDLSLERLDSRMEFVVALPSIDCGTYCNVKVL